MFFLTWGRFSAFDKYHLKGKNQWQRTVPKLTQINKGKAKQFREIGL
jgi:hypothetical protein